MDVAASRQQPFPRTLSLAHHLLQLLEAGTATPARPSLLASRLRQDPALLAAFLDSVAGQRPVTPRQINADDGDWLLTLLDETHEIALQKFVFDCATPWLQLALSDAQWLLLRDLHYRSHYVAEIARQLALRCEEPDPDEAALAGAMHNLGKLMLFSRSPAQFLSRRSPVLLGAEALEGERKLWDTDHIQLAEARIRRWPLDSYLHDAVLFLYQEPDQYQCATGLVKLLHCADLLSRDDALDSDTAARVTALLDIDENELESALLYGRDAVQRLHWTRLDDDSFCARQQEAVNEVRTAIGQLARRQLVRVELHQASDEDQLIEVAVARLEDFFPNALLFTLSPDRRFLRGRPADDQPRRFADMKARFQPGDNLPAHALLENEVVDSIHTEDFALSVLDRQLQSLVGGAGFCCLPLYHGQTPLGVAVVRLDDPEQRPLTRLPEVREIITELGRLLIARRKPTEERPRGDAETLVREIYHELGNPLSAIRNHLYVMKRNTDDDGRAALERIETEITRISDLLGQYRQRSRKEQQSSRVTDINQLARETIARIADDAGEPRTIESELDPALLPTVTNHLAIQQMLTNLVGNAVEATGPGNRVAVTTSANWRAGDREFIEVCVIDDGPGLPEPVVENLFRPVNSTKGGEHAGLGLHIVKSLADEIGAAVHCHSGADGTRFQILIPYQPSTPDNNEKKHHEDFIGHSLREH